VFASNPGGLALIWWELVVGDRELVGTLYCFSQQKPSGSITQPKAS
jgi:hypothetical protein